MILLAESGSTKTQWRAIYPDRIEELKNTPGINPLFLSFEEIESIIRPVSGEVEAQLPDAVYFFGAGCATLMAKEKIGKAIFSVFESPAIIIDSDLIAACLSLAGNKPSIIGILGTGSNSCLWNGEAIEEQIPSMGYVLGDEGGGVSIGKQLLSDFFKKQMPAVLQMRFSEVYDISREKVIERVYQLSQPNRYLASFAPFVQQHIDNPYCKKLISDQFENFVNRNLLYYCRTRQIEANFCGSIAFAHADILTTICKTHNLIVGSIVKEPVDGLANYLKDKVC